MNECAAGAAVDGGDCNMPWARRTRGPNHACVAFVFVLVGSTHAGVEMWNNESDMKALQTFLVAHGHHSVERQTDADCINYALFRF